MSSATTTCRRFAEMRYARGGFSAGLSAQAFQMLDRRREPHRRVPALDLTYSGRVMDSLGWTLGASWTAFEPPGELPGGRARMSGERAHVESRLQLPFLRSWGSLKLGAGYRYTSYALEAAPFAEDTTPERAIAFADLDGSLFFDRDLGERTIWTLEPRGYYLYQGYEAQGRAAVVRYVFHDLLLSATVSARPILGTGPNRRRQPVGHGGDEPPSGQRNR